MTNEQMKLKAILGCFDVSDLIIEQGDNAIAEYIDERFTIGSGKLSGETMVRGSRAILSADTHTLGELQEFARVGFIQAQDLAGAANKSRL